MQLFFPSAAKSKVCCHVRFLSMKKTLRRIAPQFESIFKKKVIPTWSFWGPIWALKRMSPTNEMLLTLHQWGLRFNKDIISKWNNPNTLKLTVATHSTGNQKGIFYLSRLLQLKKDLFAKGQKRRKKTVAGSEWLKPPKMRVNE